MFSGRGGLVTSIGYEEEAEPDHCTQRRMAVAVPLRGQRFLARRV